MPLARDSTRLTRIIEQPTQRREEHKEELGDIKGDEMEELKI